MISCEFCVEAACPEYANVFLGADWPYAGRVLYATRDAFTVPGYGPQLYPYALVIPRRHILSVSDTTPSERAAILSCLSFLLSLEGFRSSALTVFEHGGCSGQGRIACLDHCHLHVIDGSLDLRCGLASDQEEVEPAVLSREAVFKGSGQRYLFAGIFQGGETVEGLLARAPEAYPQYFRRMIARATGQRSWNWREGMNPQWMRRLMDAAQGDLALHTDLARS